MKESMVVLLRSIMASKNNEKWLANYEALKAYIDEHHHLPPKNAPLGAKYLLNFAKYVRRTIKEGTCDEWKKVMFEGLMSERWMEEHTGGRRKKKETETNL